MDRPLAAMIVTTGLGTRMCLQIAPECCTEIAGEPSDRAGECCAPSRASRQTRSWSSSVIRPKWSQPPRESQSKLTRSV